MGLVWFGVLAITIPKKRVRSFLMNTRLLLTDLLKILILQKNDQNCKKCLFFGLIIRVTLNFTYKIIQTSCTNEFGLKSKENVKILLFQNLVCARVDV